jgi:hypothetical protein
VATPLFWSVERDGDAVVVNCPEPIRYTSENRPGWMGTCASALRDELRRLEIGEGTVLEATLAGEPPREADLENILLYNVGMPEAHVHAGVRLRRMRSASAGVIQRYRRVPAAATGGGEPPVAVVVVPLADGSALESARSVWLATRRAVVAALPAGPPMAPGGVDLSVRLSTGPGRLRGSVDLIKRLLDGVCASLHSYAGANSGEVAERLALELGEDPRAVRELVLSARGALLGPCDCFWLRGARVQVSPADDRIQAADVIVATGPEMRLDVELRAIAT